MLLIPCAPQVDGEHLYPRMDPNEIDETNSLAEKGLAVSYVDVDGSTSSPLISAPETTVLRTDVAYDLILEVDGTENAREFKGFLFRLADPDARDTTAFLSVASDAEEYSQVSAVCLGQGIGGITHTSSNAQDRAITRIEVNEPGTKELQVSAVFDNGINNDGVWQSTYAFESFRLQFDTENTGVGPTGAPTSDGGTSISEPLSGNAPPTPAPTSTTGTTCNICGENNVIGKGDAVVSIEDEDGSFQILPCNELQRLANEQDGGFSSDFCPSLQEQALCPCECATTDGFFICEDSEPTQSPSAPGAVTPAPSTAGETGAPIPGGGTTVPEPFSGITVAPSYAQNIPVGPTVTPSSQPSPAPTLIGGGGGGGGGDDIETPAPSPVSSEPGRPVGVDPPARPVVVDAGRNKWSMGECFNYIRRTCPCHDTQLRLERCVVRIVRNQCGQVKVAQRRMVRRFQRHCAKKNL